MLNVRVVTQPLVVSVCVTVIVGVLHVSVAVTNALTLASVGKLPAAGLQPKLLPVGDAVMLGALVSVVQLITPLVAALLLPQGSLAVMLNVRVVTQPLVVSVCVTAIVGVLHVSVAVTNALTLASVAQLPAAGLQPKLLPAGDAVMLGALVSVVQL